MVMCPAWLARSRLPLLPIGKRQPSTHRPGGRRGFVEPCPRPSPEIGQSGPSSEKSYVNGQVLTQIDPFFCKDRHRATLDVVMKPNRARKCCQLATSGSSPRFMANLQMSAIHYKESQNKGTACTPTFSNAQRMKLAMFTGATRLTQLDPRRPA